MAVRINQDTALDEINADTIRSLLLRDSDEDIYFDFREVLDSDSPDDKYNIRISLVSFANTLGGFIFFGILDKGNDQREQGLDRLVGVSNISNRTEIGKRMTQTYLESGFCIPLFHFEEPRIVHVENKDVVIVKIPRSEMRPHAVRRARDTPLEFWVRGSGTVRPMDYEYLLSEVDESREIRGWLTALYFDLHGVQQLAKEHQQRRFDADQIASHYHSIVSEESGNLLRVLSSDVTLIRDLFALKQDIMSVNDGLDVVISGNVLSLPPRHRSPALGRANSDAAAISHRIESKANHLLHYLRDNYHTIKRLEDYT